MRVIIAPQALKGSLDAPEVGQAIAEGVLRGAPDAEVHIIPVADGGEGTVRALVEATGGEYRDVPVHGPLGEQVIARFGILSGTPRTGVIEMAAASGLPLVPAAARDPSLTTTYGTGELICAALDAGCERLLIGIGGSATNDGGAGMAQALGARLLDVDGHELPAGGGALARVASTDITSLDPRLRTTEVLVACDVTNPLTGPTGASAVFGPQKGATPEMVAQLDASLAHYAEVLGRDLGAKVAHVPGAGAAGGLGAGLLAFTHAQLVPGARLVLDALHFDTALTGAQIVVTAEGRLDDQTAFGKSVGAVAAAAHAHGIPVIALVGSVACSDETLAALGIAAAIPIADGPLTLDESMARAPRLIADAAARVTRLVLVGRRLG